MGLFKRKDSKPSIHSHSEKDDRGNGSFKSRDSTASLKSPKPANGYPSPMSLPEVAIPKAPDPALDPAAYLRSIHSVRDRSRYVLRKALNNRLNHFDVDMSKFAETAGYVVSIIKVGRSTFQS